MENVRVSQNFTALSFDSGVGVQQGRKWDLPVERGAAPPGDLGMRRVGFGVSLSKRELFPTKRGWMGSSMLRSLLRANRKKKSKKFRVFSGNVVSVISFPLKFPFSLGLANGFSSPGPNRSRKGGMCVPPWKCRDGPIVEFLLQKRGATNPATIMEKNPGDNPNPQNELGVPLPPKTSGPVEIN